MLNRRIDVDRGDPGAKVVKPLKNRFQFIHTMMYLDHIVRCYFYHVTIPSRFDPVFCDPVFCDPEMMTVCVSPQRGP